MNFLNKPPDNGGLEDGLPGQPPTKGRSEDNSLNKLPDDGGWMVNPLTALRELPDDLLTENKEEEELPNGRVWTPDDLEDEKSDELIAL